MALASNAPGSSEIHYDAPAGWQAQAAGGVRQGSFLVTDSSGHKADMSVTSFPGTVGGDLANVNRWRGQLRLAPVDETALASLVQTVAAPAGPMSLVDLTSEAAPAADKEKQRMLGAWLKQSDRTWFFKLVGDATLVAVQHDAFLQFLQSVKFTSTGVASDTNSGSVAPVAPFANGGVMPPAAEAPADAAGPAASAVTWTAPSAWTPKPLGAMRKGSFSVHGADAASGEADLSIISFPGAAGGLNENINRWRGQIQLPPLASSDLAGATSTLDVGSLHFTVVDFAGQGPNGTTRILGAVLSLANETYFFKLMGPDALVEQQKSSFLDFLKTVKAP